MKILIIILIIMLSCFIFIRVKPTQENLISFVAPELSTEKDKGNMSELMRLGSQGIENSRYDTVDTQYLQ
jgi:hypothetical protein